MAFNATCLNSSATLKDSTADIIILMFLETRLLLTTLYYVFRNTYRTGNFLKNINKIRFLQQVKLVLSSLIIDNFKFMFLQI